MSLCINPRCIQPDHPGNDGNQFCQGCGSELLLLGRYRVMRMLSDKSGFSKVYEAFDRSTPKILKVLKDSFNDNSKAVDLFQQEAIVLSQLPHPGIPGIEPQSYFQYFSRGASTPMHCIIMEKIDGPNLKEWMKQQGNHPISEKQALQWLKQLAEILHLVHQKNYFHRDIKPENIMLRSNGQLVLVDFGAAREMTFTYLAQLGKSGSITRISSAGYTPPEQEKGQAVPQSDFYALGCTFIYLLTGKQPTDSSMYDSLNNEFHWRSFAPDISPQLSAFIDRLIAPRASDRPKNTQEILTTLSDIEAELSHPLPPTRLQGPPALFSSAAFTAVQGSTRVQGKVGVGLWGGAIALALALGGYSLWQMNYINFAPSPTVENVSLMSRLEGHTSAVKCLAISPDGSLLVSGSDDQTIKVWDIATGRLLRTLTGHTSSINALVISPDGKTLVSAGADRTIKIWDLATGQELRTLTGHTSYINALVISPDGQTLVSGSADQTIKVWSLTTGQELHTLTGHTSYVNALVISPDGQLLASGSADQTIKIWNLATGQELRTLRGHTSYVNALVISPDGQTLISASADQTIKVWNLATGEELRTLKGHTSFVEAIAISPDGQTLVSGSADQTVKIWNLATGEVRHTLTGFGMRIKHFVISPDWQLLASGSYSKTIKIWRLPN
jgi:WD40 repeat protein